MGEKVDHQPLKFGSVWLVVAQPLSSEFQKNQFIISGWIFFNEVLTEEFFSPPFETPRGVLSSSMADVRWAPVVDMHTSKVNSDRIRSPTFFICFRGGVVGWPELEVWWLVIRKSFYQTWGSPQKLKGWGIIVLLPRLDQMVMLPSLLSPPAKLRNMIVESGPTQCSPPL